MPEQYIGWALVVGLAIGGALVWFAVGRLPRSSEDITPQERAAESEWISQTIEERGGIVDSELVDEILELHAAYLAGDPLEASPNSRRE
jgi:hypothetical protein